MPADSGGHRSSRQPSRLRGVLQLGRHRSAEARERSAAWRVATPAAFVAAGALLVTSAVNSAGTDLRPGQYGDLADLAQEETDRVSTLRGEIADLNSQIDELSNEVHNGALDQEQREVDRLEGPAGLSAVEGPGLTVTLDDAPEQMRDAAGTQVADAIVHQQDIQAVVNEMWAAGADAVTIQGQRVISTTGIKCVGNTVLLHGVTYSPPYVISGIGDPDAMKQRLYSSPYIQAYLSAVDAYQLGWDVKVEDSIKAPAAEGTTDLRYARPAGQVPDDGT